MAQLFLSYARDDCARARQIANAFLAEGYDVWWDQKIPAGLTWREFIPERIRRSSAVVVLWTRSSVRSDWVGEEASFARSQNKLLPVRLDPVDPPFGFREVEAANLIGWSGARDNDGWKNLTSGVRRLVRGQAPPRENGPTYSITAARRARGVGVRTFLLGAALASLAVFALLSHSGGQRAPAGEPVSQAASEPELSRRSRTDPRLLQEKHDERGGRRSRLSRAWVRAFDVGQLSEPVRAAVLDARDVAEQGLAIAVQTQELQQHAQAAAISASAQEPGFEHLTFDSGDIWAGQARNAGSSVMGVYTARNGLSFSGRFRVEQVDGALRLFGDPYVRELRDGARFLGRTQDGAHWVGAGVYQFADGGSHAGVWVVGAVDTFGVRTFADGRRYEGQFRHVRRANYDMDQHGYGVLWSADGRVIQAGRWSENRFVGH